LPGRVLTQEPGLACLTAEDVDFSVGERQPQLT
jgi:hypothetical protein